MAKSFIKDASEQNEAVLMYEISRMMKRNFDRRSRGLGLTRSQWMMVGMLRRYPGIKQADLAEKL